MQASEKLGEAATMMAASPGAMQLRTLQTMAEISAERNSTIIFPIPVELLDVFRSISGVVPPVRPPAVVAGAPVSGAEVESPPDSPPARLTRLRIPVGVALRPVAGCGGPNARSLPLGARNRLHSSHRPQEFP